MIVIDHNLPRQSSFSRSDINMKGLVCLCYFSAFIVKIPYSTFWIEYIAILRIRRTILTTFKEVACLRSIVCIFYTSTTCTILPYRTSRTSWCACWHRAETWPSCSAGTRLDSYIVSSCWFILSRNGFIVRWTTIQSSWFKGTWNNRSINLFFREDSFDQFTWFFQVC